MWAVFFSLPIAFSSPPSTMIYHETCHDLTLGFLNSVFAHIGCILLLILGFLIFGTSFFPCRSNAAVLIISSQQPVRGWLVVACIQVSGQNWPTGCLYGEGVAGDGLNSRDIVGTAEWGGTINKALTSRDRC